MRQLKQTGGRETNSDGSPALFTGGHRKEIDSVITHQSYRELCALDGILSFYCLNSLTAPKTSIDSTPLSHG